jgi:hypothetical protein
VQQRFTLFSSLGVYPGIRSNFQIPIDVLEQTLTRLYLNRGKEDAPLISEPNSCLAGVCDTSDASRAGTYNGYESAFHSDEYACS